MREIDREPTKKVGPNPLVRATDVLEAPRPLSPVRKYSLPIGIAASLVLLSASAVALEIAASPHSSSRAQGGLDAITDVVKHARTFLTPSEPTRLGGAVAVPVPVPTQNPVPPPPVKAPIPPHPNPPKLGGDIAPPRPND